MPKIPLEARESLQESTRFHKSVVEWGGANALAREAAKRDAVTTRRLLGWCLTYSLSSGRALLYRNRTSTVRKVVIEALGNYNIDEYLKL